MNLAWVQAVVLAPLPRVPSRDPIYKTTVTTTVDETTSTFAGVDIGEPHPKRIVIFAVFLGVTAMPTGTINGIPEFFALQVSGSGILAFLVPTGTTATLTLSATGSLRKGASVYVAYPQTHLPLDFGTANNLTADGPLTLPDTKVQAGGFLIYSAGGNIALVSVSTTWTGVDPVTEDVDATIESTNRYSMGRILVTASSDLDDLTVTPVVAANKRVAAASWGPPSPGN